MIGNDISVIFSRASQIFCESYVLPEVFKQGICREIQMTIVTSEGSPMPVVASVTQLPNGRLVWIFIEAENRNRLFHELETAQQELAQEKSKLELLAHTDSLTGINNRRAFDDAMDKSFNAADRFGDAVSVLLIDIDYFKTINDTHGHEVGDKVLELFGEILKGIVSDHDVIARYGGDEFVCLLNRTTLTAAESICEKIHQAVRNVRGKQHLFTVSIGVSGRAEWEHASGSTVLSKADEALYKAKKAGRNTTRTSWATPIDKLTAPVRADE